MQYPELEDKTVIVTGGSSGIGRAAALVFAENGAKVVVAARSQEGCDETCQLISNNSGKAIAVSTDVSKLKQVESLVDMTIDEFGGLDFAFNNAGTMMDSCSSVDMGEDEWQRIIDTNLKSVWAMMKFEIPEMKKRGAGAIVNTASVAAVRAAPTFAAYAASKAGVIALSKSVASEVAELQIRVNVITPGFINTPMSEAMDPAIQQIIDAGIPLGRRGTAQEVGKLAVWLCSEQASYMTGQSLHIDGGSTT